MQNEPGQRGRLQELERDPLLIDGPFGRVGLPMVDELAQMSNGPGDGPIAPRAHPPHERQQFMAYAVPSEGCVGVARILAERNGLIGRICGNGLPWDIEQRTDEGATLARDAAPSPQAGPAHEVQQQGLDHIVAVVGGGHRTDAEPKGHIAKPFSTGTAGQHLHGAVRRSAKSWHMQGGGLERDLLFTTPLTEPGLILFTDRAAQTVFCMGGHHRLAQLPEDMEHDHAVQPPAQRNEHGFARGYQPVHAKRLPHLRDQHHPGR